MKHYKQNDEDPIVCPKCKLIMDIKAFGPFFPPDKEYSFAMQCPKYCIRGPLKDTMKEARRAMRERLEESVAKAN